MAPGDPGGRDSFTWEVMPSGFLGLLFGRGKQDVVQDEPADDEERDGSAGMGLGKRNGKG